MFGGSPEAAHLPIVLVLPLNGADGEHPWCAAADGRGSALTHACNPAHKPPNVLTHISGQSMAETIAKSNGRQLIKADRGYC